MFLPLSSTDNNIYVTAYNGKSETRVSEKFVFGQNGVLNFKENKYFCKTNRSTFCPWQFPPSVNNLGI